MIEPTRIAKAHSDSAWVKAMQEELLQFMLQKVWVLVDLPKGKKAIGTKWVFRNKNDERGIVIRNKARLVAQGHTQEEGIDSDEFFAPVARIEAIRLFLAYASFMRFVVYQMDVKSAFLYGTIEEEVYMCQPPGFEDPDYPNKVYKVVKALYGLHLASRAWYERLANYLLENRFKRGNIDQTLFIKKQKGDILLVQMSSMGELTFFLGLQVKQKGDGIFISQDKYVAKILRKFGFTDVKSASTPMDTKKPLLKDSDGDDVDVHLYKSMIGSLMYLTSSRPDIIFAVCACARFQVTPKMSNLHAAKRIFRYLKGHSKFSLWYLRDSPFDLVAYSDSDYAGASLDRKSTTGSCKVTLIRPLTWPHDSPLPRVNILGSDEGSMTLQELMVFCTILSKKVESLETDLKKTKQIYGAAYTRLIKKVKKLKKTSKSSQARRRARIVISDDEDDLEDPSKQGRKIAGRYGHDMEFDFDFDAAKEVSTAEKDVPSFPTADDITMAETMVYIRKSAVQDKGKLVYIKKSAVKDKGKGKMAESKTVQTKTKLQQEQERLDFEAAVRLQAKLEEEERQRIVRVHEAASSFNVEEWEDIQARVEADEELVQRLQAEEREKYTEAKQARMLAELINQRKRYFVAQRAKERRNKPPTQAQQRTYMSKSIRT
ncbi:putative ribonuclease H-like domain-containing protein [Tanacetum coccineum]